MRTSVLLVFPALFLFIFFFCGGLIFALIESFFVYPEANFSIRHFSIANYITLIRDIEFYLSLLCTFTVAVISTLVAVCGGVVLALFLRKIDASRQVARIAFQLPITIPHLIAAICVMLLLSQSGILARVLGFSDPAHFPVLVNDRRAIGIILTYLWKEIPFIGLIGLSTLQSIGHNYEAVAETLGANRWEVFRRVLLPMLSRAIMPVSVIVFAFIFGSYEVPFVLGVSYPPLLPILAYRKFIHPNVSFRPEAMALNIIIAIIMIVLTLLYVKIVRRMSYS